MDVRIISQQLTGKLYFKGLVRIKLQHVSIKILKKKTNFVSKNKILISRYRG